MDPTIGAALITGGVSAANNAANVSSGLFGKKKAFEYNSKLQAQQNAYNERIAAIQNQRNRENAQWAYDTEFKNNVDFWNMQNAYNTPSAQMERLRRAGLNPYTLNASADPGNAGAVSSPDMNTPDTIGYSSASHPGMSENMPELQLDSVVTKFFDAQLRQKQIQRMDAEIENIRQDTVNKSKNFDLMSLNEIYNGLRNKYADDMFSTDLTKRYNVNAKLRKELETLAYKLEYILPENFSKLVNENDLLLQKYGYNEEANPLKIKSLRFDNTYRWLRNNAQRIENKYLDDYFNLRNSNMTETNRQLWFGNQLRSYGNDVLEDVKDNGITTKNLGKLTRYYYLQQILSGVAPGVAASESVVQPFETLMRPVNDMGDRFMRNLQIIGGLFSPGRMFSAPPVPQWHERERYNPATGEQYYYERYR